MAAVTGTLTGAAVSASFTPTDIMSDVSLKVRSGQVVLEGKAPDMDWMQVTDQTGLFSIITSDTSILYRFRSTGATADADYYIGP
jgi:hypothetical protein